MPSFHSAGTLPVDHTLVMTLCRASLIGFSAPFRSYTIHQNTWFIIAVGLCMYFVRILTVGALCRCLTVHFNPLDSKGNYSATSNNIMNNIMLVHWPLMGGLLRLVQRGGDWVRLQPAQSPHRCTKCNSPPINGQCTNHCIAIKLLLNCC